MMLVKCLCKTCKKQQEVSLDKKTETGYCDVCKNTVELNFFQKEKLKIAKKYRVLNPEVKGAYFVKCKNCDNNNRPKLQDEKGYCSVCQQDLNLSKFFITGYKDFLVSNGKNT